MKDLQVSPTTAVAAEPPTAAEVSTEAEMAGAAISPTAADATAAAEDVIMEAETAVACENSGIFQV